MVGGESAMSLVDDPLLHTSYSYGTGSNDARPLVVSASTSDDSAMESGASVSSGHLQDILIPRKLRPFVERLQNMGDLSPEDICAILFVIHLADSMLRVGYASFLTRSFVDELRKKLNVGALDLELEIAATRWTYQHGTVMTYHRFTSDYDGYAMQELSRIALGVLEDSISVLAGIQGIQKCLEQIESTSSSTITQSHQHTVSDFHEQQGNKIHEMERWYRQYPGRVVVFSVLASCGSVVYYGGTMVDFVVCLLTGTTAGSFCFLTSVYPQLSGIQPILIAATTTNIVS